MIQSPWVRGPPGGVPFLAGYDTESLGTRAPGVIPFFTGYDAESLVDDIPDQLACLPPLVIAGVGHVQDVTVAETQPPARQTAVLSRVILK